VRKDRDTANTAFNFNGGILCVTNTIATERRLFVLEGNRPVNAWVYAGNAIFDFGQGVTRSINVPLQAVPGAGVASINVTDGGAGYIAPPVVAISGGGGSGAYGIARIDRETGKVIGVDITCPGRGYTSTPTVTFSHGGHTVLAAATATITPNLPGGLIKRGNGTFILNVPNTYKGPTVIEQGTLRIGHPQAIHLESEIIVHDGTLDLNGHTITNFSLKITGSGKITNGKILTSSAVKTGDTTAILDADIVVGEITPRIPGLWEGFLSGTQGGNNLDTSTTVPKTTIELTTTAANSYTNVNPAAGTIYYINDKPWVNNSTYVYSGYIWNRNGTNEMWTFAKSFDDAVLLRFNGIEVMRQTTYNTIPIPKVQVTALPGPNAIEIRFGQGSGGVGAMQQDWWQTRAFGLGVDYLGRNENVFANYEPIWDDGTGSRLTATPIDIAPDTAIRVLEGTLKLPTWNVTPGMYEAYLTGTQGTANIDLTTPAPPSTVVEQTTTAAHGFVNPSAPIQGKPWQNHSTYIYSGYIWNRSSTNETWTFAKSFDDSVRVTIDGAVAWTHTQWDAVGKYQVTVAPGANTFEIRFGQGSGGVGMMDRSWWTNSFGVGVDYLGRNADVKENYVRLDSGSGPDWRITLTADDPKPDLLSGTLIDASGGGTLDLGDLPRNGLVLSPAGDDAIGTMNISGTANNALNGVIYRVTLGANKTSDKLTSTEILDLTGLRIIPSNLASENPLGNDYVIAQAGGYMGIPTVEGLPTKWKIVRKGGNQLVLTSKFGTVILLR
jgi:autotransporter-associated beta strand protein